MKPSKLISLLCALLLMLTAFAGCAAPAAQEQEPEASAEATAAPAEETPAQTPAPAYQAGTYTAVAQGKKGDVTVEVTFSESAITDIQVISDNETADLKYIPFEVLPQLIVESQSLAVDAVAGATYSTVALKAAVADAADQAGGDGKALYNKEVAYAEDDSAMKPGTYVGEAYGYWKKGDIEGERHGTPAIILPTQVEVTVDEHSILSVNVLDCSDTPGLKEPAIEAMPGRIVEAQSILVDTVSGSTMTAAAISSAVAKALEQAGADLSDFAKAPEKQAGADVVLDADLVVVGAGLSGTVAAMDAVERGLKVVTLEKTARVSGMGALSSGPFAVNSSIQQENGVTLTVADVFTDMMDYAFWKTNASLVYNIIDKSGQTIDWLNEKWHSIGQPGFVSGPSANGINQMHIWGKGTAKYEALWDEIIIPGGGELLLETEAQSLIVEDGAVKGVVGTKRDGTKVIVNAADTIVCTGGFGGNDAMMKELLGSDHFALVGLSASDGDGINMAQEAGAILSEEISPHLAEFCSNNVIDFYHGYMKFINQAGFLMVDPAGERYMNEEFCMTHSNSMGAAAMRRADYSYVIFTQKQLDTMIESGLWGILGEELINKYALRSRIIVPSYYTLGDEMEAALSMGQAFKADTLEGLGDAIGLDKATYTETIENYLAVIASGEDVLFGKSPELLHPLDEGPFYAVRITSPIDGTLNGIKVNKYLQALGQDQQPIDGLYVTGMDAGGFFTYPYNEYLGSTTGFCINSARIAVEHIAEK